MQSLVTLATDFPVLTHCMNPSFTVDHERSSGLLFQCVVSVLWLLLIF
jgi:hypothetical protein